MRLGLLAITAAACSASADTPRRAFVRAALVADDQRWLDRDPAAVAGKYRRMAGRTFDFFRGSAGLYWRDVTGAGDRVAPSRFGDRDGAWLWIVGDPHVENLGTHRRLDGTIYVDWNDFDAATRGPWWLDLRRLALGVALAADDAGRAPLAPALVELAARAYAAELARLAAGGAPVLEHDGPVVAELCARAAATGDGDARLRDYTRVDDAGRRVMFYGDVEPVGTDGTYVDSVRPVGGGERVDVERAVDAWRTTALVPQGALLGVSRRLGAGVASYPAPRYYALLAGPTAAVDDDVLLELKEQAPPPGLPVPPPALAPDLDEAARAVAAERALGAAPDGDALLGHATVGARSFHARVRSGYARGVDLADLVDDDDGLRAVAALAGRSLARAHALAPTVTGAPAWTVIAPRLAGATDALVAELVSLADADADAVRVDAAGFADDLALDPLLGAAR